MKTKCSFVFPVCMLGIVCALGFIFPATISAQTSGVVANDAWARVPAPSKTETALYMVIENHTSQPRAVVAASSDAATKMEMHQMKMVKSDQTMEKGSDSSMSNSMGASDSSMNKSAGNNDSMDQSSMGMSMSKSSDQKMMVMTPISKIDIPANGKTTLAPNGLHMMMFGLKTKLASGDKINVTLKLDDGTTVPVVATVRQ
jgi:copper(I)-binding protein